MSSIGGLVSAASKVDVNVTAPGSVCWTNFDSILWLMYGGAAALPILLAVSFTMKRRKVKLDCCGGRPGAAYPWDVLTFMEGRAQLVLAMTLICYPVYLISRSQTTVFSIVPEDAKWLASPLKLCVILTCGLSMHPIFLSVTHPSILTICIALIVTAYQTVVVIMPVALCTDDTSVENLIIEVLLGLPTISSGIALTVILIINLINAIRHRKKLVPTDEPPNLQKFIRGKETYVRNLLKRRKVIILTTTNGGETVAEEAGPSDVEVKKSKMEIVRKLPKQLMDRLKYEKVEGFHYPLTVLCSVTVSSVLLYLVTIFLVIYLLNLQASITDMLTDFQGYNDTRTINQVFANVTVNGNFNFGELFSTEANLARVVIYTFNSLINIVLSAIIVSALNGVVVLISILFSYRQNILLLYAGRYDYLVPRNQMAASSAVVGMCKYGGYQVGYCAWALTLQFFAYTLTMVFLWYAILMPIVFDYDLGFTRFLLRLWPTIVIAFCIGLVQSWVPRLFFVASRGKKLAIRKRPVFLIWNYYSFIISTVMGLFSCLLRLLKSFVISFVFLSRLDWCSLPPRFRFLDSGHLAYIGQLHTDVAHSHPVMIVFIELLKRSVQKTRLEAIRGVVNVACNSNSESLTINDDAAVECYDEYNGTARKGNFPMMNVGAIESIKDIRRRNGVKFQWLVAYTLINNPELVYIRKESRRLQVEAEKRNSKSALVDDETKC